jgi:tryptophan-rich sensory protein
MIFPRDETSSNRPLLVFVLLSVAVGMTASVFTEPSIPTWYAGLHKPHFNPPNWLFAPVWTTLYVLMGIAAGRIWKRTGFGLAIQAWGLQLVLNFFWSALFFWQHQIGWALADLGAMWLAILATLILFSKRDQIAGLLMLPYLVWVSFAFALNASILSLN